jgi:hypothetical protein
MIDMPNVNDFIDAISKGNLAGANTMFGELMQDRLNQALDDKKIELAQGMIGIESDEDVTTEDEDENAEVSGVSGSD